MDQTSWYLKQRNNIILLSSFNIPQNNSQEAAISLLTFRYLLHTFYLVDSLHQLPLPGFKWSNVFVVNVLSVHDVMRNKHYCSLKFGRISKEIGGGWIPWTLAFRIYECHFLSETLTYLASMHSFIDKRLYLLMLRRLNMDSILWRTMRSLLHILHNSMCNACIEA